MNYPIKASLFPAVCFAAAGVILLYVVQILVVPEGGAVMFTRIVWGNYISPVIVGIFLVAMFLLFDKRRKLSRKKNTSNVFLEETCLLYTSPSPRDATLSRMPSSA